MLLSICWLGKIVVYTIIPELNLFVVVCSELLANFFSYHT